MAEVVPEVGAFGVVEGNELCGLRRASSSKLSKFAGGTVADFGSAFDAHAEVPGIHWEFSLEGSGWRFGRILFGFEEELHEMRTDEIDRSSTNWRVLDNLVESESVFRGAERDSEAAARSRGRKRAEVEPSDDGESAEGADEKFVKIIAGDIFDHAAAAFAEAAGAIYKFGADEEVARGAVRMAKRGVDARGDDAADGGFKIERDGKREELFLFVERSGEVVEIGAGVHADREITGIVVGDLVEAGHVESNVVAGGRHADFKFGAMAAGDEGEFFEGGEADDFGYLLGRSWLRYGGGNDFVDGILRADCWIGIGVRSADSGFEADSEI